MFVYANGAPLTEHQFWAVKSRALNVLGLAWRRFGTLSFQIEAASMAAAMGYRDQDIQRIGRWHSRAFQYYFQPINKF